VPTNAPGIALLMNSGNMPHILSGIDMALGAAHSEAFSLSGLIAVITRRVALTIQNNIAK
jgi:hypothetical protein